VGRVWATRLRWRLRGAWQAPAFGLAIVAEAFLLHELPIAGDEGPGLVGGLLLATFFNLVAVAVLAPLGGWALRRRRGDLPAVVARDYAGTAAVAGVAVVLVALGLAHRDDARAEREALAAGLVRVREYVRRNGPDEFRRHVDEASSMRFGEHLYRTCVPGDDPERALCLFVSTDTDPPGLRLDPSRSPNTIFLPSG
jgi:hypothetical protein